MGVTTIITMECNECGLLLDGGYESGVNARLAALAAGWENVEEGGGRRVVGVPGLFGGIHGGQG